MESQHQAHLVSMLEVDGESRVRGQVHVPPSRQHANCCLGVRSRALRHISKRVKIACWCAIGQATRRIAVAAAERTGTKLRLLVSQPVARP
jgi:hypothetical protein